MKKFIVLLLCISMLPVSVFAADVSINTNASFNAKLGTVWGYDFTTNQTGFREIIQLDFLWGVTGFQSFGSDTEGIDVLNEPYGYAEVAGLNLNFNVTGQTGDYAGVTPDVNVNYEMIYGQINFYPFYLMLAAGTTHFDRVGGYNFRRSTSAIRANWAFMDYRFQHEGVVSPGYWSLGGAADQIKNQRATSLVGLGFATGETEMMLAIGSPADWTENEDNQYDLGLSIETPVIENLTLQAAVQSGINYRNLPLEFGTRMQYRQALDDTYTLLPYVAVDGRFLSQQAMFDELAIEQTAGVVLEWPGPTGWGWNPLAVSGGNVFSGLSVALSNYSANVLAADMGLVTSAAISLFEERTGGVVPGLGAVAVLELADLLGEDTVIAYGLYLDYDLDEFLPFTRIKKGAGDDISMDLGLNMDLIPNTDMKALFTTNAINNFADATVKAFTFEVTVGL